MRAEFPDLDADEIIQEALIALVGALPNYTYDPTVINREKPEVVAAAFRIERNMAVLAGGVVLAWHFGRRLPEEIAWDRQSDAPRLQGSRAVEIVRESRR